MKTSRKFKRDQKIKTIKLNKGEYLLDNNTEALQELIKRAKDGKKCLLVAQTGTGKTHSLLKLLEDSRYAFSTPLSILTRQMAHEWNLELFEGSCKNDLSDKDRVSVIYDSERTSGFNYSKDDALLLVDEAHYVVKAGIFRGTAITKMLQSESEYQGVIHMTATPQPLDYDDYDYILEFVSPKKENEVKIYNVPTSEHLGAVLNITNKCSKKFLLYKDDKQFLNAVNDHMDAVLITADTKDDWTVEDIIKAQMIGDLKGICATSVVVEGVNLKDLDIEDVIIVGCRDITSIIQFAGRARKSAPTIHIIDDFTKVEEKGEIEMKMLEMMEALKVNAEMMYSLNRGKVSKAVLDYNCLEVAENGKFVPSKIKVMNKLWDKSKAEMTMAELALELELAYDIVMVDNVVELREDHKRIMKELQGDIKKQKAYFIEWFKKNPEEVTYAINDDYLCKGELDLFEMLEAQDFIREFSGKLTKNWFNAFYQSYGHHRNSVEFTVELLSMSDKMRTMFWQSVYQLAELDRPLSAEDMIIELVDRCETNVQSEVVAFVMSEIPVTVPKKTVEHTIGRYYDKSRVRIDGERTRIVGEKLEAIDVLASFFKQPISDDTRAQLERMLDR